MNNPGTCIHFRGIQHDACCAGVQLVSVRDTSVRPYRWPCSAFDGERASTMCSKYTEPTAAQIAEGRAEVEAIIAEMHARTLRGECILCAAKVTEVHQIGSCVYASPCGHRIGQGRADEVGQSLGLSKVAA